MAIRKTGPDHTVLMDEHGSHALISSLIHQEGTRLRCAAEIDGEDARITVETASALPSAETAVELQTSFGSLTAKLTREERENLGEHLLWSPREGATISMDSAAGPLAVRIVASASPRDPWSPSASHAFGMRLHPPTAWGHRLLKYWPDFEHPLTHMPTSRIEFYDPQGSETTFGRWTELVANPSTRVLRRTKIRDFTISTVFTGLNFHRRAPVAAEPPLIFETAMKAPEGSAMPFALVHRAATREECEDVHGRTASLVRTGNFAVVDYGDSPGFKGFVGQARAE